MHSFWGGDTKVDVKDRTRNSRVDETPTHKPRPSRFRAEAVPFVTQNVKEKTFEVKRMDGNMKLGDKAPKQNAGTLLESTNLVPQSKVKSGPFGYVGMEKINRALENNPQINARLGESYGSNSFANMSNNSSADLFDPSTRAAYNTLKHFQARSRLNGNNHLSTMKASHNKMEAQDQTRSTGNTASPMDFATFHGFDAPSSFSSRYRANKPASLQLDDMSLTGLLISANTDTSSTDGGVKLDAAAHHA